MGMEDHPRMKKNKLVTNRSLLTPHRQIATSDRPAGRRLGLSAQRHREREMASSANHPSPDVGSSPRPA
ncbi:hypothetical protein RJT34_13922 [Clitoria ternatea]|uniref:Uncharacterized protein n=1 Tax=Clitoria ternatea TaxID=43366 RepID=A0AAN9JPU5_CLITE